MDAKEYRATLTDNYLAMRAARRQWDAYVQAKLQEAIALSIQITEETWTIKQQMQS